MVRNYCHIYIGKPHYLKDGYLALIRTILEGNIYFTIWMNTYSGITVENKKARDLFFKD